MHMENSMSPFEGRGMKNNKCLYVNLSKLVILLHMSIMNLLNIVYELTIRRQNLDH